MAPKGGETDLTPDVVLSGVSGKMDRAVDAFKRDLTQLRTGHATPALVENVEIDYYGAMTPLKQIASISAPDARAIMIQPWDTGALKQIEKSLMAFLADDLGRYPAQPSAELRLDPSVGTAFIAETDGHPPQEIVVMRPTGASVYTLDASGFSTGFVGAREL